MTCETSYTHRVFQQVVDEEGEGSMPRLLLDWQSQLMLLFTQTNSTPTSGVIYKREGRREGRGRRRKGEKGEEETREGGKEERGPISLHESHSNHIH